MYCHHFSIHLLFTVIQCESFLRHLLTSNVCATFSVCIMDDVTLPFNMIHEFSWVKYQDTHPVSYLQLSSILFSDFFIWLYCIKTSPFLHIGTVCNYLGYPQLWLWGVFWNRSHAAKAHQAFLSFWSIFLPVLEWMKEWISSFNMKTTQEIDISE